VVLFYFQEQFVDVFWIEVLYIFGRFDCAPELEQQTEFVVVFDADLSAFACDESKNALHGEFNQLMGIGDFLELALAYDFGVVLNGHMGHFHLAAVLQGQCLWLCAHEQCEQFEEGVPEYEEEEWGCE
jgi:hypothetical protein